MAISLAEMSLLHYAKDAGNASCSRCTLAYAAELTLSILWRNIIFSLFLLLLHAQDFGQHLTVMQDQVPARWEFN